MFGFYLDTHYCQQATVATMIMWALNSMQLMAIDTKPQIQPSSHLQPKTCLITFVLTFEYQSLLSNVIFSKLNTENF